MNSFNIANIHLIYSQHGLHWINLEIVSACVMDVDLKTVPDYHGEDSLTEKYALKPRGLNKCFPLWWVSQIKDLEVKMTMPSFHSQGHHGF